MKKAVVLAALGSLLLSLPCMAQSPKLQTAVGYAYTFADQGNGHANLNGWFVNTSYSATGPLQLVLETDNYTGSFRGQGVNQHSYAAGPQLSFNSSGKFSPFVQALVGGSRSSSPGSINWGLTAQFGAGVQVKIAPRTSLYFQPVEYDLARQSGTTMNSYAAKVGLSFTLAQQKK